LTPLAASGISIPISYTAHLAPISSSKLHADVTGPSRTAAAAETPYVVMMSLVNLLSGEGPGASGRCGEKVQQCWQFEHPRRDLIVDAAGECGDCDGHGYTLAESCQARH
jgi:protein arginine N-methyltransferase 5